MIDYIASLSLEELTSWISVLSFTIVASIICVVWALYQILKIQGEIDRLDQQERWKELVQESMDIVAGTKTGRFSGKTPNVSAKPRTTPEEPH